MKIDRYLELCKIIEAEEKRVEEGKRESYTVGDSNVLANFMRDASTAGIDPLQNWLTHFLKQVAAVVSYIRNPEVEPSEPLISRVVDLRVYSKLLLALAEDEGRVTGIESSEQVVLIDDGQLADMKKLAEEWRRNKHGWPTNTTPWRMPISPGWPLPDPPFCGSNVIPLTVDNTGVTPLRVGVVGHHQGNMEHLSTGMHDYTFGKDW